jgi:hypothetical protein
VVAGKLSNVVREMVTSTALAVASGVKRKQLLVMDEVDGMSGEQHSAVSRWCTPHLDTRCSRCNLPWQPGHQQQHTLCCRKGLRQWGVQTVQPLQQRRPLLTS